MAEQKPKYKLIVKVKLGANVYDRPAAQADVAMKMRSVQNGTPLLAYSIIDVNGVPYADLVPQNPLKPEYIRVRERDSSIVYTEVVELPPSETDQLIAVLTRIASALEKNISN